MKRTSNFPNEENTWKTKKLLSGINSKTDNEEKSQRSWEEKKKKKKKKKQEIIKFEQQRSSGKKLVRTCETTLKGVTYVLLESQSRGERGWVKKKNLGKKNGQKFDECHKFSDLRNLGNPDRLNSKNTSVLKIKDKEKTWEQLIITHRDKAKKS